MSLGGDANRDDEAEQVTGLPLGGGQIGSEEVERQIGLGRFVGVEEEGDEGWFTGAGVGAVEVMAEEGERAEVKMGAIA